MDLQSGIDEFRKEEEMKSRTYENACAFAAKYPDGVTLVGFKVRKNKKGKTYNAYDVGEENVYIGADAGDLKKQADIWLEQCDGDVEELDKSLAEQRPKFKIWKIQTDGGNDYVKIKQVESE